MGVTTFEQTAVQLYLSVGYLLGLAPGTDRFVTDIKGWNTGAAVRRPKTERLNGHGNFHDRGYKDARYPSISGHYVAPSRAAAAAFVDEINAVMADGTEGVLEVNDIDLGVRRSTVYLLGPDVNWHGGVDVAFSLDFEAPDPRKYSDTVSGFTGVATPGGGLYLPLFGSPGDGGYLDFGTGGSLGTVTITNRGSAESDPRFIVTGYAPGFTITERETQRRLVYTDSVPEGQSLTLNSADGTVLLNGDQSQDRSTGLILDQWPDMPGGTTRTYLFESSGAGPTALLTAEVDPAWW
jgi:hypothetical protein